MTDLNLLPPTLLDLLSNTLILRHTIPYLPIRALLHLTYTSKALRHLLHSTPDTWRHLNLTAIQRAKITTTSPIDIGGISWRAERMDESLTEEDFYAGPLRGILASFHSKRTLKFISTLILDGLSVPADLIREILSEDRYRVRVLSIRDCNNLNISRLQQILRYVVRPTREENTPSLQALYVFGPKDDSPSKILSMPPPLSSSSSASLGVMSAIGAQIGASWNQRSSEVLLTDLSDEQTKWYTSTGRVLQRPLSDWAETLTVCKNLIHFDAVLCRGPRHDITKVSSEEFLQPSLATIALGPRGCEMCHSCPEGVAMFGTSPESHLPLLGPIPTHSSTLKAALRPDRLADGTFPKLILRCEDCLRGRWCEQCNRWWCETCYPEPLPRANLRTELQQVELQEEEMQGGVRGSNWATAVTQRVQTKVFSKLCVEFCLVGEMMAGAGSGGMWG